MRIDPAWLNRIQEITDWALAAGLNVIINTHMEEELYWLIRDNEFAAAERHLNAIWSQVAERFKDYPEGVLFEILNEPNLLEHYQGAGEWDNVPVLRALFEAYGKTLGPDYEPSRLCLAVNSPAGKIPLSFFLP